MQTHNARPDVPKDQHLSLSEEEVEKLSGSQLSVSKGGHQRSTIALWARKMFCAANY